MYKKLWMAILLLMVGSQMKANDKLKFYFNHPVDTTVSHGMNAVYLNHCMADTIVAYINRAQISIDIAQYDYNQGNFANIATAINYAYGRGVKVRWIYDGSSSNSGLSALNSGIHTLGSPTSSYYGIMHNKFVIIDEGAADSTQTIVLTGSPDWSSEQFNTDYNNLVVIQSEAMAKAYKAEFEMMWGSNTTTPNSANAKFGPDKTDLGLHQFIVDGTPIELYFSPSDNTNAHIQSAIQTANTDLYFGVYTFTDNTDASMIVARKNSNVYVAGIIDQYSESYSPYHTFTNGLGNNFILYTGSGIYHNKYMVVDPSDTCSDPLVLTGSHNWTTSANTKNDENTVIIHDAAAANSYYQAFRQDFEGMGGTLSTVSGCTTAVPRLGEQEPSVVLYPNPTSGATLVKYSLAQSCHVHIQLFNAMGVCIADLVDGWQNAGSYNLPVGLSTRGVYWVRAALGNRVVTRQLTVL